LKENVIVGRLIPAGTGMAYHQARHEKESFELAERQAARAQENPFGNDNPFGDVTELEQADQQPLPSESNDE